MSSSGKKPYFESDHFNGGGSALAEQTDPTRQQIKRLHTGTVNNKIFAVGDFFVWAHKEYKHVVNPLEGLKIDTRKMRAKNNAKARTRLPFKIEELNLLFSGPIYSGCKSVRQWKTPGPLVPRDSARFWVPLIALYTGMRMGEIIQLHVNDVQTMDGIPFLNVTTLFDADDSDEPEKSLKNENSQRQIPLHNDLLRIGFGELVKKRRQQGKTRIFPDYSQSNDESWSKSFSKWFGHYRAHVGVKRIIQGKDRVQFHSFRHSFEDVVRNLRTVKKEVRDALQGHGELGSALDYGTGLTMELLNEGMQQVSYIGLDLHHLSSQSNAAAIQRNSFSGATTPRTRSK